MGPIFFCEIMNRRFPLFLLALIFSSGCSKSGPDTPAEFTKSYVEAMHAARADLKVEVVKDLELKVTTTDDHSVNTFLNNAYDVYKQDPRDKAKVLKNYVATGIETVVAASKQAPLDPSHIIPIIKDRAWLDEVQKSVAQMGAKKPMESVTEDFNQDLVIVYAEDSPQSIRYIGPKDLETAKIGRGDLRKLACANLEKLLPPIQRHGGKGSYMITAGGTYEASLLLLDSIWTDGKLDVQGDIVVAVPTRDLLIVTGSKDAAGLEKTRKVALNAAQKGSYRLTPKLFVYRRGKFEEFKEPAP